MSECPHCGCNDVESLGDASWWGAPRARQLCNHCGRTSLSEPPASDDGPSDEILYHIVHCPRCGHDSCPVTSTRRPIRHHRCGDCGHSFKSREA